MLIVFIFTYLFLFNFSYLAVNNSSSYQESEGEDISLGSQDTNIDELETQDLEEEEATMHTPKKPSSVKKKTTKKLVDNVADDFATLSVKKSAPNRIEFYSVNWSFPYQFYSVVEGSKDILYTDFFTVNLPQAYIKQAKVLKGGMQFSFGMAVPKWFYEE